MVQTDRERLEALRAGDLKILQMIAAGSPLLDVLDALVRVVEEQADGMLGSVLFVEDGARVRHAAAPHLPPSFMQQIDGQEIGPAHGSCGTAAYRREPVIVEDIATDPLWAGWRAAALAAGLRACWSVPILSATTGVIGTFALYYTKPRRPTPELIELTRHASHIAAIAIERRRSEEALRASETRARLIVENALDANVIMDGAGTVTEWSGRAAAIFGWTAMEAVGRRLSDLIIPERFRAHHEAGLRRYLETGKTKVLGTLLEISAVHKDGHEFPVELFVTAIALPEPLIFSAFIRDISERKRSEVALAESERHRSLVYDHVADVLFDLQVEADGGYRFVSLNPTFERATGLTPAQVLGKRIEEVIPPSALPLVLAKYAEAIRTRQTVRWDESTEYPSGIRHGDVSVTPVFDNEGKAKFLIGSVRDVTVRRQLEAEVRQLQKMEAIARLSGGIAHDFNNILSVILMCGNMLLQDITDPDIKEQIEEIIKAGERGAGLTRQFLAFSRKQVLRPEILDLNLVVANIEKMLRRIIGENIQFRTALAENLWRVEADPGQIEQVIMNLVVNARDAMSEGGKLTIETANVELDGETAGLHLEVDPGPYVVLAVTDSGCGMDQETQRRIFEPFFTTKDPGKGTGLGLATVYGIIKQSGGDIWVYSEPNAGSTFKVYLRRTTAVPVPAAVRAPRRSSGRHMLGHVLVVEDEPALRSTLARLLTQLKFRVTVAATAEEALAAVGQTGSQPDLLITDITLPAMSGKNLVERLRATRPELKVLYISGYPDEAIAHHGVLHPGTPFLQKPFTIAELSDAIEELLDVEPSGA